MTRIGPYGNGDCSRYCPGAWTPRWSTQIVRVECFAEPRQAAVLKRLLHGGSANLALRDGKLAVLGIDHVKILDAGSLKELNQCPTRIRRGWPGWDFTWAERGTGRYPLAGHSTPAGLSTLYWLDNGLIHVRSGGDVKTSNGLDFVRVSGDAPIPDVKPANNQREWIGLCDGNPTILFAGAGHAFGRSTLWPLSGAVFKAPTLINNPCFLSTPDAHYVIAPSPARPAGKTGFITWSSGLQINRLSLDARGRPVVAPVFETKAGSLPYGDDGYYHPQPWCLSGGLIHVVSDKRTHTSIDVSTGTTTSVQTPSLGFAPRVCANPDGVLVCTGQNAVVRPGAWSVTIPLAVEVPRQNQQFCNHVAINDASVFVARLINGRLIVSQQALKDGTKQGLIDIPIESADETGRVCDFFAWGNALYCLLTPCEPLIQKQKTFHQLIVRVS